MYGFCSKKNKEQIERHLLSVLGVDPQAADSLFPRRRSSYGTVDSCNEHLGGMIIPCRLRDAAMQAS